VGPEQEQVEQEQVEQEQEQVEQEQVELAPVEPALAPELEQEQAGPEREQVELAPVELELALELEPERGLVEPAQEQEPGPARRRPGPFKPPSSLLASSSTELEESPLIASDQIRPHSNTQAHTRSERIAPAR
jgi:hypothetical protein